MWQGKQFREAFSPRLLLLCLFIVLGGIAGYFAQKAVDPAGNAELSGYLRQYAEKMTTDTPVSLFRVLVVYFRYPLLAFCLGFCTVGVYLIPVLSAMQGFVLSFSICCFASAMGRSGVYLAFSAFGLRVLVTLPCFLCLSLQAFEHAKRWSGVIPQRKTHTKSKQGASYFALLGICCAVLLVGTLLEITLIPHVFQWVMGKIT